MNSDKIPSIIYADIESLIKNIDVCTSNNEWQNNMAKGQNTNFDI